MDVGNEEPGLVPVQILVVEDEPLIRCTIAEALRDLGVTVIEAASADEAWGYLLVNPNGVDLVFTDHRLPGSLLGADLALKMQDKLPHIKVVLTSGDFYGEGWKGLVRKPYDVIDTAEKLADAAKGSRNTQMRRSREA